MKKSIVFILSILALNMSMAQNNFKISLAEWSLHRRIQSGKMTNIDFPRVSREEFGIGAIVYVSILFDRKDAVSDKVYLQKLKTECEKYNVKSNLIMDDGEGNLGDTCIEKRNIAVQNHRKWINAAQFLGCHSIRVNAAGDGTKEEVQKAVVVGLQQLCDYANKLKINILVENHWGYSSNPDWLVEVAKSVNRKNFGLLPDFGNFDKANRFPAVEKMMPYAKAVSAKSYDFDEQGNETKIDYPKMLNIIQNSGYKAFIGVEFEGNRFSEEEGIKATLKLIKK